ncbi:MAG: aminoglycoside phosphotransferase family protein [Chloroflexi bacterium]|nr:aminoglycoside phosphotransferase family protein [Chloroflexota bacterium]
MLEDPKLDPRDLATALRAGWAVEATAFRFVPGYDMHAASYEVATPGARAFLKVRFGPAADAPLEVPRALLDAGVPNILAPKRTLSSALWHAMGDGRTLTLYPFVAGRNAMEAGMTADQWRSFGSTLRAVHDSALAERLVDRLPAETFGLASAAAVRATLDAANRPPTRSPAGERLGALLRGKRSRIEAILERAAELGARLGERPLARVLCHADIHAANVLVADDGRILLVDWDGPMFAPRERDLMFIIGSRIARPVEPHEEAWFFEGYGEFRVDPDAIVYYRYERILEDLGEIGSSVFGDRVQPESSRESEVSLAEGFFGPGGILEDVERVWPRPVAAPTSAASG